MKMITVMRPNYGAVTIEAPEGKEMVYDQSLLAAGILSLGEYGPSGTKIAAFHDWDEAIFHAEGYTITR